MSCEVRQKLDAYVDGELPPAELAQVEIHLRECAACASEALKRMQMKRAVQSAASSAFVPSPDFRARIRKSITEPRKRAWSWQPVLAFAGMAVVLLVAGLWGRHSSRSDALAEIVDLHVSTIASANPVDVVSSDRHTVKPWFEGKLPFTFNLPELQNTDFRLLGGRMAYVKQSPAAQLIYAVRKHQISVFVLRETRAFDADGSAVKSGFLIDSWTDHGLRYVMITDASSADVDALSKLLRSAEQ